jgi:AcrR family transcriptional regulator
MIGTRERIVTATGELFRRQGYNGTSLKQVTAAAGAPFGSLYHFFPGGKEELADEVIRTSGAAYRSLFELVYDAAADPPTAVTDFFDGAAAVLEETGYLDACPIRGTRIGGGGETMAAVASEAQSQQQSQ